MSNRPSDDGERVRVRVQVAQEQPAVARRVGWRALIAAAASRLFGLIQTTWLRVRRGPEAGYVSASREIFFGLLFALALGKALENVEPLQFLDHEVVRLIAAGRELPDAQLLEPSVRGVLGEQHRPAMSIRQLEASAAFRVRHLEQRDGVADEEIERLGGVAPIDRGKLAAVLHTLACRIGDIAPEQAKRPRIVAIDVDIAPLAGDATSAAQVQAMDRALCALRQHVDVVAITLPRRAPDGEPEAVAVADDMKRRNEFMAFHCTREALLRTAGAGPRGGLFFASPLIFHKPGGYSIEFLGARNPRHTDEPSFGLIDAKDLPPWYPSLGSAVYLLHEWRSGNLQEPALTPADRSLTAVCEQAHRARQGGPILEDQLAVLDSAPLFEAYVERPFNWRLLDEPRLRYSPIESTQALAPPPDRQSSDCSACRASSASSASSDRSACCTCNAVSDCSADQRAADGAFSDQMLVADVVMFSIDGGARHDKFEIAGTLAEPVSGATLHSLQAMSLEQPVRLQASFWLGLLVDAGVALCFMALWGLAWALLAPWRARMPVVGAWLAVLVPPVIGVGLVLVAVELAVRASDHDLFINPAYIALGLVMDVYARGWREANRAPPAIEAYRSSYFGLLAARDALYSGYGHRVGGIDLDVLTRPSGLEAHARVRGSGLGAAALTDALLSAAVRVAILAYGLTCLLKAAWMQGGLGWLFRMQGA